MGNLGEEDLEKLVPDYIESSIRVPDHMEKSSTAIVTLQEILRAKGEKEKEMEEKVKSFIRSIILSYEGDDEKRDAMKKNVSKLRSDGYNASIHRTSWNSSFAGHEGRVLRSQAKKKEKDE